MGRAIKTKIVKFGGIFLMALSFERTFWIKSFVSSSDPVQIHPSFNQKERQIAHINNYLTIAGGNHSYKKVGGHFEVELPLDFINSETNNLFTNWWRRNETVYYTENLSSFNELAVETILCKISNINEPFVFNSRGQHEFFSGTLRLRSISNNVSSNANPAISNQEFRKPITGMFILDDPTWGKLDQSYNRLL